MIQPQKHLNLNICVLRISALVLAHLRRQRVEKFPTLLEKTKAVVGADAEILFLPAVNLLFLLGRLAYHPHTDIFEYLEPADVKPATS